MRGEPKVFVFEDAFIPLVLEVIEGNPETVERYVFMPVTKVAIPQEKSFLDFNEIVNRQSPGEIEDVIGWERDISEICYTSGTTAPKVAMISHLATYIPALETLIEMVPHLNEKTIMGMMLSIFHCGGGTINTSNLFAGGTTVLFRGFDPVAALQAIEKEKISLLGGLPMMWRVLYFHPNFDKYDTSAVDVGIDGMVPMDKRTLEFLVKDRRIFLYLNNGQTEFIPPINYRKSQWQLSKECNYWGAPGVVVDEAIMDDEGILLPTGEVGEVSWRGPACMEGYLRNPEATEESRAFV
jgi:long-chain acyl-CoA synthetase